MDRFEAMLMLREVVDKGSLSAAARSLRVPVSTLSRKISELEARIGTRLLVRTTRSLTLTDAGSAFLVAARRILDEVEDAEREAAGEFAEPKGELVLTAPIQFGRLHVLPIVADFLALLPKVDVKLLLSDRNLHLVEDHVDLAVRIGRLVDSTMVATRIGSMRIVVCASPGLLDKHGTPASPGDLWDLPAIAVDGPMLEASWRFHPPRSHAPVDVPLALRLSVTTTEAAAEAAALGVGVARLLHYQVAEGVAAGALRMILEDCEPEPAPVHLVHASGGHMPLKLRSFLDFAAPRLRERLGRLAPNIRRP